MKHRLALIVPVGAAALGCTLALGGCSTGYPDIAGVWKASDGSTTKTISDDGNCTNMFYRDGKVFPSPEPGMCHIIDKGTAANTYDLEVAQGSATVTYTATISSDDKTIKLALDKKTFVTLTLQPGQR